MGPDHNLLTDQTNDVGQGLKRPRPKLQCLAPKKGPAQERLVSLITKTPEPRKVGETQDTTLKVCQDPPKGKESKVICALCSPKTPKSALTH